MTGQNLCCFGGGPSPSLYRQQVKDWRFALAAFNGGQALAYPVQRSKLCFYSCWLGGRPNPRLQACKISNTEVTAVL